MKRNTLTHTQTLTQAFSSEEYEIALMMVMRLQCQMTCLSFEMKSYTFDTQEKEHKHCFELLPD